MEVAMIEEIITDKSAEANDNKQMSNAPDSDVADRSSVNERNHRIINWIVKLLFWAIVASLPFWLKGS
jgi:hypothetical protein